MSERESHTFALPKGYDGVSGFNGMALFNAIQQEVERLFLEVRADVTHLFVSEPDYDLLTQYFCSYTTYSIEDDAIKAREYVKDQKVVQVMNFTTGTPMQFSVSPKLEPGTCAVLYHPYKRGEA